MLENEASQYREHVGTRAGPTREVVSDRRWGRLAKRTRSREHGLRVRPEPRIPPAKDVFPVAIEDTRTSLQEQMRAPRTPEEVFSQAPQGVTLRAARDHHRQAQKLWGGEAGEPAEDKNFKRHFYRATSSSWPPTAAMNMLASRNVRVNDQLQNCALLAVRVLPA